MDESGHAVELSQQFYTNWERHNRHLLRYALRVTRNYTDAEEIADQALVNFIESMERRKWIVEVKSIPAYLRGIARNLYTDLLRRRGRETPLESDDEQGKHTLKAIEEKAMRENNPTSRYEDDIDKQALYERLPKTVISKLSDEEKDLFERRFVHDSSANDIATALGKDVCYIRYQLNKLNAKIRWRARRLSK